MIQKISTFIVVIFLLTGLVSFGSNNPASKNFFVEGSKIIDPNGNQFIVKGVNVNGPHWPWKRSTVKDVDLISDVWKFNTVRVNCFPRLDFIQTNLNLDEIVEAFTQKKVVSMLEVHDYGGTYPGLKEDRPPMEEFIAWWVDKAERFKGNPYVWFNLMNEPGGHGPVPELWKTIHEEVIKAIRATGAENIIVLDGHGFGQEGGYKDPAWSGVLKYGPYFAQNYDNIIFSIHPYSLWAEAEDRYDAYVKEIKKKNLPLIFGEFGEASRADQSASSGMFKVAIPNDFGRIVWHWSSVHAGNDLTAGTEFGDAWEIDRKDGSKPTNLNWLGNIIWDDNHNQLDMKSLELTGPPVLNGNFENRLHGWQNYGGGKVITGKDSVSKGEHALLIPEGKSGGGTSQLLLLEPNTTYRFSATAKYMAVPEKIANVMVKYMDEKGESHGHALSFNNVDFRTKSVSFTTPDEVKSPNMVIFKQDATIDFIVDDIRIEK